VSACQVILLGRPRAVPLAPAEPPGFGEAVRSTP
jgi:hypothetical protein